MLDANLTAQLKQYLAMLREPIELVATLATMRNPPRPVIAE
jgi:alkyl hydroperoxide reductase subunit AhpF